MRLSILLPTHNRADSLEWALRSVAAQTERDFEVLICGDGCTDGTSRLALEWEKRNPRFLWFDLPKGPGFGYANRNHVLRQAQGECIGFMAHDDLVFSDHFARMLKPFADPQIHLTASRPLWVDAAGTILPMANNLESSISQQRMIEGFHYLPATSYMHRREAFAEVGYWNDQLPRAADLDFWQRIVLYHGSGSVRYLTTPGVLHFRAIWKTAKNRDPHQLDSWQRLLTTPGAFPEILRSTLADNEFPQAHIGLQLLAADGLLWEKSIRRAAELALESFAESQKQLLHSAQSQLKRLQSRLQSQLQEYRTKHADQKARADKWKQKCETLRAQSVASRHQSRHWWSWLRK